MKRIELLLSLVLMSIMAFCFSACSKEDSGLIGSWELDYFSWCDKKDGKVVFEGSREGYGEIMEFKADGTFLSGDAKGKWSYKNGEILIKGLNTTENNKIKAKVVELTNTKLVFECDVKTTEEGVSCERFEHYEYHKVL